MPFPPKSLPDDLQTSLREFVSEQDFAELYKSYDWGKDKHSNGFPDIFALENDFMKTARNNYITIHQIRAVAKWGQLPTINNIQSTADTLRVKLFQDNGVTLYKLADNPLFPLNDLDRQTSGLGPTYLSKVLRFCLPMEYGSLDTRIVRVFGNGDPNVRRHNWLSLRADKTGDRFYISRYQAKWPSDYAKWINILRFLSSLLNSSNTQPCPHPTPFSERRLRIKGVWVCADVEMALFSYASSCIHTR